MNYRAVFNGYGYRIAIVLVAVLAAVTAWTSDAGAFDRWSVNRDATNCRACHGDFRSSTYTSLVDGQLWGNLHNIHRQTMLNGDCNVCHGSSTFPVLLASSSGGSGLQAISCLGCHGRSQDAGHDDTSAGLGAGLRQHHTVAGVNSCTGCHSDAVPANYTPVGENVKPPYYANPGTNHPAMPTDPCNRGRNENFAGALIGLDNDGDGLVDGSDPDCRSSKISYDGDVKTDVAVWRPSTGIWYILRSSAQYDHGQYTAFAWGNQPTDKPVPGDYDGDGKTDIAVWRPGTATWYILQSSNGFNQSQFLSYVWGASTDVPVPGDYDGDGKTDLAVWRPSDGVWYVLLSSTGYNKTQYQAYRFGDQATDKPVPGDYDGDGKTDIAMWRPGTGTWYILQSSNGFNQSQFLSYVWGASTDIPVPGDYDGDGKTDIAVWRPSDGVWYVLLSSTGYNKSQYQAYRLGDQSTDIPVPGDYDGDGKTDYAVWRPSTGDWYVHYSSNGALVRVWQWGSGAANDQVIKSMY